MKMFICMTNVVISLFCLNAVAMEQSLLFNKATHADVMPILKVINEQAIHDNTKIVILPKKFRQMVLEGSVSQNRLYCVKNHTSNEVVAFKKLFIINDSDEHDDITQNEIRCHGEKSKVIDAHSINESLQKNSIDINKVPPFSFDDSVSIYFGGDYTVPNRRDEGISSKLIRYAFEDIKNDVIEAVRTQRAQNIVLLYGLTKANAGETVNGVDRTPSIIRAFMPFVKTIAVQNNCKENNTFYHSRYEAFMPTFDPEDIECKPLPDDQAISGYGNVLLFPLIKQ